MTWRMSVEVQVETTIDRPLEQVAAFAGMTLRNRGQPSGFSKLLAPMMAAAMRRETTKDLARLKAVLERA